MVAHPATHQRLIKTMQTIGSQLKRPQEMLSLIASSRLQKTALQCLQQQLWIHETKLIPLVITRPILMDSDHSQSLVAMMVPILIMLDEKEIALKWMPI